MFQPKLSFWQAEYALKDYHLNSTKISNDAVYNLLQKITNLALPNFQDKYEKRWEDFYLPLKRRGKLITIPFIVIQYKRDFFAIFHLLGNVNLKKGKDKIDNIYKMIFKEALRFSQFIKDKDGDLSRTRNTNFSMELNTHRKVRDLLKRTIPYDFRTGRIKGKYVLAKLVSKCEQQKIWQNYQKQLQKGLKIKQVSLNDYLKTASFCYKAAYAQEAKNLSPLKMYKKWADNRDGGMLAIKDWNSRQEFKKWYKSGRYVGSHPFEIVFSWHRHGIHLYPPSPYNKWRYALRVTNYVYAWDLIKMIKCLIQKETPLIVYNLKEVLDYLTGETDFVVNNHTEHSLFYIPSREYHKVYFKHIQWDEPRIVRWKKKR